MVIIKGKKYDDKDKFNFFVPVEISKGASVNEQGEMIIEGDASDDGQDYDGEFLNPSGFDFEPLLQTGVINWNHRAKDDPDAIVGEPITAYITPENKFRIKGKLYKGDKKAESIYNKIEVLKKNKSTRQIGWSIEGIATDRDPLNPKRVRKAMITGVALTHCPKNSNTFVNIVKGDYSEAYIEPEKFCPNCVDKLLVNGKCDECNYMEKDMSTSSIAPLMPESVETDDRKILTKSQVYFEIIKNFNVDLSKAKEIYEFVLAVNNKIHPQMQTTENGKTSVTDEALQKSFEILKSTSTADLLEKSKESTGAAAKADNDSGGAGNAGGAGGDNAQFTEAEAAAKIKELERKDELKKSCQDFISKLEKGKEAESENTFYEDQIRKGFNLSECQGTWQSVLAEMNSKNQGGDINTLQKSKDADTASAANAEENIGSIIEKAIDGLGGRFEHLFIKHAEFLNEKFVALANINQKNLELANGIQKSFDASVQSNSEMLQKIAQMGGGRRAFSSLNGLPRFKSELKKSKDEEEGGTQYSLSKAEDREALMTHIENLPGYDKDQTLQKAVQEIEIAKLLDERTTYPYLKAKGINVTA